MYQLVNVTKKEEKNMKWINVKIVFFILLKIFNNFNTKKASGFQQHLGMYVNNIKITIILAYSTCTIFLRSQEKIEWFSISCFFMGTKRSAFVTRLLFGFNFGWNLVKYFFLQSQNLIIKKTISVFYWPFFQFCTQRERNAKK